MTRNNIQLRRPKENIGIDGIVKTRNNRYTLVRYEGGNLFDKCNICAFLDTIMCYKYNCYEVYNENGIPDIIWGYFKKINHERDSEESSGQDVQEV